MVLKLRSDVFAAARSKQRYQNFIQGVEEDRKNIQACNNQEIGKWHKIDIFLLFQVLWRRRNTIVTIVSCWWYQFLYFHHGHWRYWQWWSQPKPLGEGNAWLQPNNSTFVLDTASQSTKWLDMLKFGAHGPLATPMGPALLVFHEKFAHSAIFT